MAIDPSKRLWREVIDDRFAIISKDEYESKSAIIVGLNKLDLDWVWLRVELFCSAHKLEITVNEVDYE